MNKQPLAYVITHHWPPNFGANLQAYAVHKLLAARGNYVLFIDYRPPELVEKYNNSVSPIQIEAHEKFIKSNLKLTKEISSNDEYLEFVKSNPASLYITGSDAVFRLKSNSKRLDLTFPNPYWLIGIDSSRQAKKIALSPSAMGSNYIKGLDKSIKTKIKKELDSFFMVSARDTWTKRQLMSTGYKSEINLVPDPVFSLYSYIAETRKRFLNTNKPYILVASQGRFAESWITRFTKIANNRGYQVFALPSPEGRCDTGSNLEIPLPLDPLEWLKILACSSGYVGGRFHPLVISLCAGVPAISIDKYHRYPWQCIKSKSWLLLKEYGIQRNCYGGWSHRLLTPTFVFFILTLQKRLCPIEKKLLISKELSKTFVKFTDRFL